MEEMENEILDFINRRWKDKNQSMFDGNCYWFARILKMRFFFLDIFYLPVEGHFVAGYNGKYFDAKGKVLTTDPIIPLQEIEETDFNWYDRLMRDCRD